MPALFSDSQLQKTRYYQKSSGESGPIGFGGRSEENESTDTSFAFYDESRVSSKIHSEYKDNPLYLIPMTERETLLRKWLAQSQNTTPDKVEFTQQHLNKSNQDRWFVIDQYLRQLCFK